MVFSHGQMEESTKANTLMIRRKVKAPSTGQMAGNMKENGGMESKTELVHTLLPLVKLSKESGKKEKELLG